MGRTCRWLSSITIAASVLGALTAPRAQAQDVGRFDLSIHYVATVGNAQPGHCGCFVLNGGGTEEAYFLRRNLAAVADLSIVHTGSVNGGAPLGLATYLFGARYALHTHSRFTPYAQGLFGAVHGFDSVFPGVTGSAATGFAYVLGGGLELAHSKRIAFRVIEASYLRTDLPNNVNGTQNNLRLAAGIVLHLR